jgi:3',5'-cyclic AMP phosphodiesterase CpdA
MCCLLQLSDAHFGTEQPAVVAALQALAAELRPEVAVWTGDLTQRARAAQFEAARRFAQALPALHTLAMPGNHDIPLWHLPRRLLDPYAGYRRGFGDELEPVLDLDDLLLMMVKTTRRWRHRHGELSAAQVQRVAERLQRASPRQLRVVATHQPLHTRDERDAVHRVRGAEAALRTWAAAGADVVLAGHLHRPDCYPLSLGARRLWVVHAGTALSSRLRAGEPNSVNVLRWDAGADARSGRVERWDFEPGAAAFRCVRATALALSRTAGPAPAR